MASPNVSLVPGNRDFLLQNLGMNSLDIIAAEEQIIEVYGRKVLIAHGHTLTEADRGFKILHALGWPLLKHLDAWLPLSLKDRCARFLVNSSRVIRPVNATISRDTAQKFGADVVICGHLHRPLMSRELIVLPAFFDTGQFLAWDKDGPRFSAGI